MKNSRLKFKTLMFLLLIGFAFASCSKDDDKKQSAPPATLSSISPKSGPEATIVTIHGNSFGNNISKVKVYFNDVEAVVQSVTNTEIITTVPSTASTGPVKVIVNGTELIGPEFNYTTTGIQVTTLAGSTAGFADGTGADAKFNSPYGIAIDSKGNLYVSDGGNQKIRKITPSGVVSTLAGSTEGFADGTGASAKFQDPQGITVDSQGNLYVVDNKNNKIRKITPSGVVSTLAGSTEGFADGTGASAKFFHPKGITIDSKDNLYVADMNNFKIRKITPSGMVSTIAGSTEGFADGPGASAKFEYPMGITVDSQGNLYVTDALDNIIRKITPSGAVSTLAGSTEGFADGPGASAKFREPSGITVDSKGNLYVVDQVNYKIRKITPSGVVSTIAGSTYGSADGRGASAKFAYPTGITIDSKGNLYVADTRNNRIRKMIQE